MKDNFLQTNANYYEAQAFQASFDDSSLTNINEWIEKQTDGEIKQALDQMDPNAVMYLMNTLLFKEKWETPYKQNDVRSGTFTMEDGTELAVEMMHSDEDFYYEDEGTLVFQKNYKNDAYGFVALLPKKDQPINGYIQNLSTEKLMNLFNHKVSDSMSVNLPKFTYDDSMELKQPLMDMGITDAFDADKADFCNMITNTTVPLYLNRILQKTKIQVNENGTVAGQ